MRYLHALPGSRTTVRVHAGECDVASARYGFKMVLLENGGATPDDCSLFLVELSGRRWHTANGLGPGDSLAKMKALFPHAGSLGPNTGGEHWARPAAASLWWLAPVNDHAMHTNLGAYVESGRVIALVVDVVGH
jgi:hypothetical protein